MKVTLQYLTNCQNLLISFILTIVLTNEKRYFKSMTLSNCTELFVPKVNPEIWGNLSANSKRSDIRMSVLQDTLIKLSSAIVVTVEDLLSHREK